MFIVTLALVDRDLYNYSQEGAAITVDARKMKLHDIEFIIKS